MRSVLSLSSRGLPLPSTDRDRLALLRSQESRLGVSAQPVVSPLVQGVLQPGQEQDALRVWQSLRARAGEGDALASAELVALTRGLVRHEAFVARPQFVEALTESALDASALDLHRQEQLGRLCRAAALAGDRVRLSECLSLMDPKATHLASDTEYRIGLAMLAVLERNGSKLLLVLGAQRRDMPIADPMDCLASVLRAHAAELQGKMAAAQRLLNEVGDESALRGILSRYEALGLCPTSSKRWLKDHTQALAQRRDAFVQAAVGSVRDGYLGGVMICLMLGVPFAAVAALLAFVVSPSSRASDRGWLLVMALGFGAIGLVAVGIGVVIFVRGLQAYRQALRIQSHGVSRRARVVQAIPVYGAAGKESRWVEYVVEVEAPEGAYPFRSVFRRLVPHHEVDKLVGREVRVRVDLTNPSMAIPEE